MTQSNPTVITEKVQWRELQAAFAELPVIGAWQAPHDFVFPEGVAPIAENLGRQILVDKPFWMFAGGGARSRDHHEDRSGRGR